MKLDTEKLLQNSQQYLAIIKRYRVMLFIISFIAMYTFLVVRINSLTQQEPVITSSTDQEKSIKPLKIDSKAIDQMQKLEDQNIEVKSLFQQARDNPFTD